MNGVFRNSTIYGTFIATEKTSGRKVFLKCRSGRRNILATEWIVVYPKKYRDLTNGDDELDQYFSHIQDKPIGKWKPDEDN